MTESKVEYTTPDAVADRLLRMEAYIAQLENTIDGFNMVMGQHRATIAAQTRRIVELEQALGDVLPDVLKRIQQQSEAIARVEQDNRRLRHLDAMPVDAMRRYYRGTTYAQYAAHLAQYTPQQYDEDGEAIDNWLMTLDGDA